ncbi:MAG: PEP-CTERM sorting domain-containing protein [Verrucomicrobiota bacterium]
MRKRILRNVLMACAVVALAGSASARYLVFWPPSGDVANWNDANTWLDVDAAWAPVSNPTAADTVEIRDPDKKLIIDTYAECQAFTGPGHQSWSANSTVDVLSGGDLQVKTTGWGDVLHMGYAGEGTLTVNTGGSVHVQANASWEGGVTRLGGPVGCDALLNMQGGLYISDNALSLDEYNEGGTSRIQLDDGLVNIGWLNMGTGGSIDIVDGKMEIRADMSASMPGWITGGKITGYGGAGTVEWDYGVTAPGVTTITAIPEPATIAMLGLGGLGAFFVRRFRIM